MSPGPRTAGIVAGAIWTLVLVSVVIAIIVGLRPGTVPDPEPTEWYQVLAVAALIGSFTTVGALLAAKRPGSTIGWLLLAVGVSFTGFVSVAVLLGEMEGTPRLAPAAIQLLVVLGNL